MRRDSSSVPISSKHGKLIDLKTTSNIDDFKWSAIKYNYDSQCYIYQELFGKPLVFYTVDKTDMRLGIFTPTEEFVQRGEEKVIRAINVYKKFFVDNAEFDINEYFIGQPMIDLAQRELGWSPTVSLENGLIPTIEWFRKVLDQQATQTEGVRA